MGIVGRRLHFGAFVAEVGDDGSQELLRGGEPVQLYSLTRKVLFVLLRERPYPVSRTALEREVWAGEIVDVSSVPQHVLRLRRLLGDAPPYTLVRTVGKRGFAFVMPVEESLVRDAPESARMGAAERLRLDAPAIASAEPGTTVGDAISDEGWRVASEKLVRDFAGSCLHDAELREEATEDCDRKVRLIARRRRIRLDGRFPRRPIVIPPPRMIGGRWARSDEPDPAVASRARDLIRHSTTAPLVVNVGSYNVACIAVLQSLHRRYGLHLSNIFEDLNGRRQVRRLAADDEADFLFTPHAPFLLEAEGHALAYRRVTPVHAHDLCVLRKRGRGMGRARKVLVYRRGTTEEQFMARAGIPASAEPEMIGSLPTLIARARDLAPGDMVIAWEPLASGLESDHSLERIADYRSWVSLFCHRRWQQGPLAVLRAQFEQLFASEWTYCKGNRDWAVQCLAAESWALRFFAAGSALGPDPLARDS